MQENLNQIERSNGWSLVQSPEWRTIIGTKWVYMNKIDESGIVTGDKAMLVVQGYNHEEGIYYDETFPPVARLEDNLLLLFFTVFKVLTLYQMDVKVHS